MKIVKFHDDFVDYGNELRTTAWTDTGLRFYTTRPIDRKADNDELCRVSNENMRELEQRVLSSGE